MVGAFLVVRPALFYGARDMLPTLTVRTSPATS
jgi:hypothetical protein